MIKHYLGSIWEAAMDRNKQNILALLQEGKGSLKPSFADFGCDDGQWSLICGLKVGAKTITGLDIIESRLEKAASKAIKTIHADLNRPLPIDANQFDLIHANQVIEHVADIDLFASEIFRTLKPGGHAVISTENASSWCNVMAVAMGWQMFSLTNLSAIKSGIGNPLALHRGSKLELSSWTHKTIFSYRGLIEFFEAHSFNVKTVAGSGYFPLPAIIGSVDIRHAHFLTILIKKPEVND